MPHLLRHFKSMISLKDTSPSPPPTPPLPLQDLPKITPWETFRTELLDMIDDMESEGILDDPSSTTPLPTPQPTPTLQWLTETLPSLAKNSSTPLSTTTPRSAPGSPKNLTHSARSTTYARPPKHSAKHARSSPCLKPNNKTITVSYAPTTSAAPESSHMYERSVPAIVVTPSS
ncbi:hypothetical protein D9619_002687 [Psilocybe cf. subviscida]|uniref:Uncharacterized protein n=1 Tax=Psilocybe cf. subviscida TaxID=2480587 RepID=A0A8H5AVU7_9AGAR|nr:hypothetical protein D9619_002687 [Psilocybe cf. subviscida]